GACEMGGDSYEVSLAESGDLHHLGDAADVWKRGAHIIDGMVFDERVEVPAVAPLLSSGKRNVDLAAKGGNVLEEGFGADGIFDEERVVLLDEVAAADSVGEVEALVEVDAPVAVFTDAFAYLFAFFADFVDALARIEGGVRRGVGCAETKCAITSFDGNA